MSKVLGALFFTLILPLSISANEQIVFDDQKDIIQLSRGLSVYIDQSSSLNVTQVIAKDSFSAITQKVPNFGVSPYTFWIKFKVNNQVQDLENLILSISNPIIDEIELFEIENHNAQQIGLLGDSFPYEKRKFKHQNFLFDINLKPNETKAYMLRVKSWELITLPIALGTPKSILENNLSNDLMFGLFLGIMLVLILYNLFIYFTVKDNSYLYYVFYITFITLTQAALYGYTFRLFFSNFPEFSNFSLILFNSIAGIATVEFIKLFLKTKYHTPLLHKGLHILSFIYIFGIITALIGVKNISYTLMDMGGILVAFYTLFIALKIALKGYRPAKIFLAAWTVFLLGVVFFVLTSAGVLPSNTFTNYTMTIGISLEGIILSIALADRINTLRAEKESSQKKAVDALQENEKIIKNQNIILEQRVKERTEELNNTLDDLKQAQSKLVDAEKMSSLGQLTAGIAHEINNPINFVSSNVIPLRQDIEDVRAILGKYDELANAEDISEKLKEIETLKNELDYDYLKTELSQIVDSIEEGANRTTEIVNGLKNFSRLDEGGFKQSDINEGIKSTFLLVKNKLDDITLKLDLGEVPLFECNPGKINQLVLNLIDNAIYATKKNKVNIESGIIKVITRSTDDSVFLTVSDNGVGISQENISKLFDPFFTTKDVGEGTGLGLSIVRGIIDAHDGNVMVESKEQIGTEVKITFPIKK